jgi:hypothetical protein
MTPMQLAAKRNRQTKLDRTGVSLGLLGLLLTIRPSRVCLDVEAVKSALGCSRRYLEYDPI